MKFLSVCSGIEAVSVATQHLGWRPLGFSEIEPFPSAVLAHHYPGVKNFGDMTKHKEWILDDRLDLLVGGCPCQAFSVAGARRSLDDERGNLTLTFCNIADQFNPQFVWYENVPGILNTKDNAFGCLLSALAGIDEVLKSADGKWRGSGMVVGRRRRVAWVTLDAQFFGVPQRRRRVFVLAVDAQSVADSPKLCPSKILSIGTSLHRDTPPRRKAGEEVAASTGGCAESRTGVEYAYYSHDYAHDRLTATTGVNPALTREAHASSNLNIFQVAPTIPSRSSAGGGLGTDFDLDGGLKVEGVCFQQNTRDEVRLMGGDGSYAGALAAQAGMKQTNYICEPSIMAHGQANAEIRSDGGSPWLTCNHEAPIIAYPLNTQIITRGGEMGEGTGFGMAEDGEPAYTLQAGHSHAVAFQQNASGDIFTNPIAGTVGTNPNASGRNTQMVQSKMSVRRLTPEECEILQGFPVGYTDIKLKGKPTPDGPRYKALGNSMAVPVMRHIASKIQEALERSTK